MRRPSRQAKRAGFTLIEIMVVAAIIAVLLSVTIPAIKGIMETSQMAQADNLLRSSLFSARAYAMREGVIAGVRFQGDGNMVRVYASNTNSAFRRDNYSEAPIYQMVAIRGEEPIRMPDPWRVISFDYTLNSMWRTGLNWWKGNEWYRTALTTFSPTGRVVLCRAVFPQNWYPTMDDDFGRWTDVVYSTQSCKGIGYNSAGGITSLNPIDGPSVSSALRIYNYVKVKGLLDQGSLSEAGNYNGYPYYSGDEALSDAMTGMSASYSDCVIDVNTGTPVRKRSTSNTGAN